VLKIVRERTPEIITECYIEFKYKDDPDAGFCFPATHYGDPDFDRMSDEACANYQACLTDNRLTEEEFVKHKWTYMNPALGICSCGKEVVLDCDHAGAVRCECGKWYNLFGQELLDPEYWEEDNER
jgi:hypothetical protein